jgi:hypothetical protein
MKNSVYRIGPCSDLSVVKQGVGVVALLEKEHDHVQVVFGGGKPENPEKPELGQVTETRGCQIASWHNMPKREKYDHKIH